MKRLLPHLLIILIFSCSPKYIINHARPTQPLSFPADDAAHYAAQMEWWYYTGHLTADDGTSFGFELTFFKRIVSEDRACFGMIPAYWLKNVGMVAHFAVTNITAGTFSYKQKHNLVNIWKADPSKFQVYINGWVAESLNGSHHVRAKMKNYSIDLALTPVKPAALHGKDGIVQKGAGTANYYYSYSNMKAEGSITVAKQKKQVHGKAWMDHEFGSMKLLNSQLGWDWFSVQLDDNTELMVYVIKDRKNCDNVAAGSFIDQTGLTMPLSFTDIDIKILRQWKSPRTGAVYPSAWEMTIKPKNITVTLIPVLENQEITLFPATYWEGAVTAEGTSNGSPIKGKGYIELVGYDDKNSFRNAVY